MKNPSERYRIFSIGAVICACFLAACATLPDPYTSPPAGASATAVFYARWLEYLGRVDEAAIQDACQPRMVEPADGIAYRGTTVLLHGYTACPQQLFELVDLLALQGYRSMLVLLPGHGRQFESPETDNFNDLPVERNWRKAYDTLAAEINGIMAYADGDRVIGGLSAGGTASIYVNLNARDLYDRQIVFAPFFAPAKSSVNNASAGVGNRTTGGEPDGAKKICLEKRSAGRAGYCDYRAKNLAALISMGEFTLDAARNAPLELPLQLVGVENDQLVSNAQIRQFLDIQAGTGITNACFYPEGVPHALISQFDKLDMDAYWLDSVLSGTIGFITDGRPFPETAQPSVSEAPWGECAIQTERRD